MFTGMSDLYDSPTAAMQAVDDCGDDLGGIHWVSAYK